MITPRVETACEVEPAHARKLQVHQDQPRLTEAPGAARAPAPHRRRFGSRSLPQELHQLQKLAALSSTPTRHRRVPVSCAERSAPARTIGWRLRRLVHDALCRRRQAQAYLVRQVRRSRCHGREPALRRLPEAGEELETVHARHQEIEHDGSGRGRLAPAHRPPARIDTRRSEARLRISLTAAAVCSLTTRIGRVPFGAMPARRSVREQGPGCRPAWLVVHGNSAATLSAIMVTTITGASRFGPSRRSARRTSQTVMSGNRMSSVMAATRSPGCVPRPPVRW